MEIHSGSVPGGWSPSHLALNGPGHKNGSMAGMVKPPCIMITSLIIIPRGGSTGSCTRTMAATSTPKRHCGPDAFGFCIPGNSGLSDPSIQGKTAIYYCVDMS